MKNKTKSVFLLPVIGLACTAGIFMVTAHSLSDTAHILAKASGAKTMRTYCGKPLTL